MSVKEKQDNEEFKVISMDQEVIKGDANKLKLLITSYAAIMEVQDAYMQEEIKTKEKEAERIEAQIASGNLTEAGVENKKEELAALTDQIRSLKEVYDKFSESRTRFMDLAKKALRLPSANFEQLAAKGYTMISGEKIELSSLASSYETAQKTLTDEEKNKKKKKKKIEHLPDRVLRFSDVRCQDFVVSLSFVGLFYRRCRTWNRQQPKRKQDRQVRQEHSA